jgi:hypothetical protein
MNETRNQGNPGLQRLVLRIMALVALPAMAAVLAPRLTVKKLSGLLGFGQPPDVPLIFYLAAGGSFVYLATSAMLWIISGDVVRYRPLVIFTGFVCVIGGPVLWWVGARAGMPSWWVLMDTLSCLVGGLVLLWACGSDKKGA